ncbi:LOW QUALITY PROTEIN: hypothetical protein HID58_047905, partial [Brassica napus]
MEEAQSRGTGPLPTQYDFVSNAKTSNLPPVVLPNNNPTPSVRDYPPPRQLFPCSTFQPSGSAPRKRNLVAPGSSINKTPRPLPTQYDFVSNAKTSNLPPVVLPNNNPTPSVRDYPPPRQLFPCSTFQPSGSAP